jgi:DNA-binding NarL/FixJ family response regulator
MNHKARRKKVIGRRALEAAMKISALIPGVRSSGAAKNLTLRFRRRTELTSKKAVSLADCLTSSFMPTLCDFENGFPRMKTLQILIADDHDLMRRGIKELLLSQQGWGICGEAKNGTEAVKIASRLKPDIAILDINMPGLNGMEAAKKIRQQSPDTEILILTLHSSDQLVRDIVGTGAKGYILKSDSDRDLIMAVETLVNHKPFLTSVAADMLLSSFRSGSKNSPDAPLKERLTPREKEIVKLLAQGKSSKEAALLLSISIKTAETHRSNIMRKLQIHTVADLVRYAVRNRIIEG